MNRVAGFGLVVFGTAVAVLMIAGCLVSDPHLMGAAVILGVPFFACLTLGVLHDLEAQARERARRAACEARVAAIHDHRGVTR